MKGRVMAFALLAVVLLSGCKKEENWAEKWVGTYDSTNSSNDLQRVVVSEIDAKTVKLELKTLFIGAYVTYVTVGNGELSTENTVLVDEDGFVGNSTDTYRLTGSGSLSGTQLIITGQAVNKTNPSEAPKTYYFNGTR